MTLGEKIATLRRENKMTQRELAEIINVSDKVISKWETGRTLPDVEAIMILSKTFNIPVASLFECIENDSQEITEKYDEERIWQYKKHTIISCVMYSLSQIFLLLSTLRLSRYTNIREILSFIALILMFSCLAISVSLIITQYIRLSSYSKGKYYQAEYKRVLKKYLLAFVCVVAFWILIFAIIALIDQLLFYI